MLKFGIIVEGPSFVTWYGCEILLEEKKEMIRTYGEGASVEVLEICQDSFSGFSVGQNDSRLTETVIIRYFFPDEETTESSLKNRIIDLSGVNVRVKKNRRKRCEAGYEFMAAGEVIDSNSIIYEFDSGYMPPFKPEDVTVILEDLTDFGYDGLLLTGVEYQMKRADYVESELRPGRKLPTMFLRD